MEVFFVCVCVCLCVWLVSPQQKSAPENINQEKFIKEKAPQIIETEKKNQKLKICCLWRCFKIQVMEPTILSVFLDIALAVLLHRPCFYKQAI